MSNRAKELKLPIYMDYQATTPVDPRVLSVMLKFFNEEFGNPHSRSHVLGWNAEKAIEEAREKVASVINAESKEIVFTSGATESNNMAIKGVSRFYKSEGSTIITLRTEHKCLLESCRRMEAEGVKVIYLPVQKNGIVDLELLRNTIDSNTILVSIMAVNNEIGVIQPLAEIGAICREKGVFFHTDAAQAFGKIPLDVKAMNIDLLSISGHKIYGPKGVGALYINKERKPRVRLVPLMDGGGQESGMRSGTLPTPLVVGLGEAAAIAAQDMVEDSKRIQELTNLFKEGLFSIEHIYLNGDPIKRVPGNLNISIAGVEGESFIGAMPEICISSGSACTSSSLEPSYVLYALGIGDDLAHTSIRFGIGRFTLREEVDYAINKIKQAIDRLRKMSPVWDMMQSGEDLSTIKWNIV